MPLDAIDLTVFSSLFSSVAEEMGVTLCRAAYSPNIKERRDYSCALFDDQGRLVAQAAHIPVHLGSMPEAVRVALERVTFVPDDLVIFNDPYLGGTHLPDVTMVSAVFFGDDLVGYVASRAHQADIGGMSPGSMPLSTELYQEGIIIPPVKLLSAGQVNQPLLDLIYRNVRTPAERAGDFAAQMAAHRTGETRLIDLVRRYSLPKVREAMSAVMDYSESVTRAALLAIPAGVMTFDDQLDDDGIDPSPISMRVTVTIADGGLTADFTGCASERRGSINAVRAVTLSAVYYVVRCLVGEDVPVNDGCFRPVHVITPEDTVVNPRPPRAVAAGNVETSQRIVDLLLGALASALPDRIPAASNGSMNNVTIGGVDPSGRPFAYYETIGGGTGAGPTSDGLSAVHSHMTNTQNTPVESLEFAYPFRVRDYGVATGTGGGGKHTGGDGIRRVYEFLCPATVTIVSERRVSQPYGLSGGQPGASGVNQLRRKNGEWQPLPAKTRIEVEAGDQVSITTPGGGGWGKATG